MGLDPGDIHQRNEHICCSRLSLSEDICNEFSKFVELVLIPNIIWQSIQCIVDCIYYAINEII